MAATETSSSTASSVLLRPLSHSQRLEKIINLRLKRRSTTAVSHPKKKKKRKCCLCYPATHPAGSFRCASHRRLSNEDIEILVSIRERKRSIIKTLNKIGRRCCFTTSNSGLNLRKTAMVNSLAGIGSLEAERCRKYLKETMVKQSSLRFRRVFRPRRSRFYALHKD
ncbi:hypothetical protein Bca52824_036496 [Brassica carinata]|uniref:Uncharacterized protein n=1 Tax=Brassica carinata TaxID=52824 RepID=A0A8X7S9I6_BRACI|nr:hypothetical protein Bca52824_036496 [Brassica carinata]